MLSQQPAGTLLLVLARPVAFMCFCPTCGAGSLAGCRARVL